MANPMYGQNKDDGQLYDARAGVIVSSGATVYKIVDGTILVQPGISSAL